MQERKLQRESYVNTGSPPLTTIYLATIKLQRCWKKIVYWLALTTVVASCSPVPLATFPEAFKEQSQWGSWQKSRVEDM